MYMHIYKYIGLEIGVFALPNANHFWGKCELFLPVLIRNIFRLLRVSLG